MSPPSSPRPSPVRPRSRRKKSAHVLPEREAWVEIGVIGAPHGVHGACRFKSYTQDPLSITDYGDFFSEDGRFFEIEEGWGLKDDLLILKFVGMDKREAIQPLTGTKVFVDRAFLPEPEEDEFYYTDLMGLKVLDETAQIIGEVLAVHNFGAGDLIEIRSAIDGKNWLHPFNKQSVPKLDLAAKTLVISPFWQEEEEGPPSSAPIMPQKTKKDGK